MAFSNCSIAAAARPKPISALPQRTWSETEQFEKAIRSEEHTSELQSPDHLVCRLLLEKKKNKRSSSTARRTARSTLSTFASTTPRTTTPPCASNTRGKSSTGAKESVACDYDCRLMSN